MTITSVHDDRAMYRYVLVLHVLGATIWTGGHLFLATRILPRAIRTHSAALILDFESRFEVLGITALVLQVVTGLWLASKLIPFSMWLSVASPPSRMLMLKFGSLGGTIVLALEAQLRVLPRLRRENAGSMTFHIIGVTILAVLFVIAGSAFGPAAGPDARPYGSDFTKAVRSRICRSPRMRHEGIAVPWTPSRIAL
jgi:putative copper export protein